MTTIAYRNGVMASDSSAAIHDGACRMPGSVTKIWRLADGSVMGHAGSRRDVHKMMRWLEKPEQERGDPPADPEVSVLLVTPGAASVLIIDGNSQRDVDAPFYAIGSGAEAALGAMYAGASAEEAVRIAMLVDPYTAGAVQIERVGLR